MNNLDNNIDTLSIGNLLDRDNKVDLLNYIMGIIHTENIIGFDVDIEKFLIQKDFIKSIYPNYKNLDNKKLLEKLIYSYIGKTNDINKEIIKNLGIFIIY